MQSPNVPVNRNLVGILAVACLVLGALTFWAGDSSSTHSANLWPGAFVRVGTVLAAFWLALPTPSREAAWARVPVVNVLVGIIVVILVARSRIPLNMLIPAGIIMMIVWVVLRPRPPRRPTRTSV